MGPVGVPKRLLKEPVSVRIEADCSGNGSSLEITPRGPICGLDTTKQIQKCLQRGIAELPGFYDAQDRWLHPCPS